MTQSNRDRVGRALETLNQGLRPFVEREMQAKHGNRWMQIAAAGLHDFQAANMQPDFNATSVNYDLPGLLNRGVISE